MLLTRCTLALRLIGLLPVLLLAACSMGKMVVQGTESVMDSSLETMNRETDLVLARDAMPANLKMLEGMLVEDPGNTEMRLYAAEGFYGYTYGFVENEDPERASHLYRRCYLHALQALQESGVHVDPATSTPGELEKAVAAAGSSAVPALFWTASCLGKWIDMNRNLPTGIAELSSAATLMQRVLELDEAFYHAGPHLFFGVYYGGRSPMLGGRYELAEEHFRQAAAINQDRLLLVDVLHAQYLDRQRLDRDGFRTRLQRVIDAPDNLAPDLALINGIAKQHARHLLTFEDDWF